MCGEQHTAGQVPTDMESRVMCAAQRYLLYLVVWVLFRHAPTAQAFPEHLADSTLCVLTIGSWHLWLECILCQ